MLENLIAPFHSTLYLRIYENRMILRNIKERKNHEVRATTPFTTTRLLVGRFSVAESLLKSSIEKTIESKSQLVSPVILIHPMEMIEGGLSEVEERAYVELGLAAGCRKSKIYIGSELSDEGVMAKLKE